MSRITRIYFGPALPEAPSSFAGKSFFVEDGWDIEIARGRTTTNLVNGKLIEQGGREVVVKLTSHNGPATLVTGLEFEVVRPRQRGLDEQDFVRMNLPLDLRKSSLDKVADSAKEPVANYIAHLQEMVRDGLGLILLGNSGVGKTSIAALIGMAARKSGFTVFFSTVNDLREMIRARLPFDAQTSIAERCREVDVLILDNLQQEDANALPFDRAALDGLLESRAQWQRTTFITSRMSKDDLKSTYSNAVEVLRLHSPVLTVVAPNKRVEAEDLIAARLKLSTPKSVDNSSAAPKAQNPTSVGRPTLASLPKKIK